MDTPPEPGNTKQGRPPLSTDGPSVIVPVRMPPAEVDAIAASAARRKGGAGITRSEWIRDAARRVLRAEAAREEA